MPFKSEFSPPDEPIPPKLLEQIGVIELYANGSKKAVRRERVQRIQHRAIIGLALIAIYYGGGNPEQFRDVCN